MKITDVEAIVVKQPTIEDIGDGSQDTVVVRVHTDAGISGVGEADSSPYVVREIIYCPAYGQLTYVSTFENQWSYDKGISAYCNSTVYT